MDEGQLVLKRISKVALAAMGVLFIGAIVFYKERLFFADGSYMVFNIINNKSFIVNQRYGDIITQVIPFIGQKLHLPIAAILIGFAISFNLFSLTVAYLLVYSFKLYRLVILMAVYYFLFVSDSYYMYGGIQIAVSWMFLFFGVIIYLGREQVNFFLFLPVFLILAFLTVSTHFIVIIPTVFLWVYFIIEKKIWPFSRNISILLSCLLAAIVWSKFLFIQSQSYDSDHLHGILHISLQDIIYAFNTPVVKMFFNRCITNYWLAVAVFIISIFYLGISKEKMLLLWTIISCVGYLILMGITYGDLDNNVLLCHIEQEWGSLAIIIATPFVFSFLPKLRFSYAATILAMIFTVRLLYILVSGISFSSRINSEEAVLAKMRKEGITKLALFPDATTSSTYILDWAIPFESLLMSAMKNDSPQLTFCFVNKYDTQNLRGITDPNKIYITWGFMNTTDFNKQYFKLDSLHPYQIMTYEELMK